MNIHSESVASAVNFKFPVSVEKGDLERISANADNLRSKAMELTDSWEGVMFKLRPEVVNRVAIAVGFAPEVAEGIHDEIVGLNYAKVESNAAPYSMATWHSADATFLTLCGLENLDNAFAAYSDENLLEVLDANQDVFQRILKALPDYAHEMNFLPETCAKVLQAFGSTVSADLLYNVASKYGTSSCIDLEGRRGVNAAFIRSVTLTLVSTLK